MGHTVYPMRWVIYDKIRQFEKLIKGLRNPEKRHAQELLDHVYKNISAITYSNPLPVDVETNMVYSMLIGEKKKKRIGIEDSTILAFSNLVHAKREVRTNEGEINRLLFGKRQNSTMDKD